MLGLGLLAPVLGRTFKFVKGNLGVSEPSAISPGALGLGDLGALVGEGPFLGALFLGLVSVGVVGMLRSPKTRLAGVALIAAPAALFVLMALRPLGYSRFALFALPSLLALAGCGVSQVWRRNRWALALLVLVLGVSALQVRGDMGREHQDLRGAMRLARSRAAHLGGAPLVGLGPGGELLAAYAPETTPDSTGVLLRGFARAGLPVVCVVPLPGWLAHTPEIRAALWGDAFADPVVLPGREQSVLVFVSRTPAGR